MEQTLEKTTTVNVEISEELAIFASEYAEMIGTTTEKLLRACLNIRSLL